MNDENADHLGFVTKECPRCGDQFDSRRPAIYELCSACALQDEADSMEEWFHED